MKGEQTKEEWKKEGINGKNWGKNNEVYEFGVKPKQGKRNDIHRKKIEVEKNIPLKEIIRDCGNYQCCKMAELKYKYLENKRPIGDIEVIWIYGGTARERKKTAYSIEEDAFTPISDKWWDGYDMDKTVLVEEWDNNYCSSKRLCQLTDIFPFRVETKGGSRQVQYDKIIFTSKDYPSVDGEILERLILRNLDCAEVEGNTNLDFDHEMNSVDEEEINKHIEAATDIGDDWIPDELDLPTFSEEDATDKSAEQVHPRLSPLLPSRGACAAVDFPKVVQGRHKHSKRSVDD